MSRARYAIACLGVAVVLSYALAADLPEACVDVGAQGTLSIEGIGVALFTTLSSDRARDALRLGGGVCIELDDVQGVLRADEVSLENFSIGPTLNSEWVSLRVGEWSIEAASLQLRDGFASLENLSLAGERAVGFAARMAFTLDQETLTFEGIRFATEIGWVDAGAATMRGNTLALTDVLATTCDCAPTTADLYFQGTSMLLNLDSLALTLVDGQLHGAGGALALPNPWVLDGRELMLALPLSFGREFGVQLRVDDRTLAPGAVWSWSVQTGSLEETDRPQPARFNVDIRAREDGATVRWTVAPDRFSLQLQQVLPLTPNLSFLFRQRLEAGLTRPVRETTAGVVYADTRTSTTGVLQRTAWETTVTAGFASEGDGASAATDAPLRQSAVVRIDAQPIAAVQPSVLVEAIDNRYMLSGAHVSSLALTPAIDARLTPLRVRINHLARWTQGQSPFEFDRIMPLQRTELTIGLDARTLAGFTFTPESSTQWVWDDNRNPQLRLWRLRLDARGNMLGGELTARADTNLARWVAPQGGGSSGFDITTRFNHPNVDAQIRARFDPFRADAIHQLDIGGVWKANLAEFGWNAVLKGATNAMQWTDISLSLALPVQVGSVALRPLVEVDALAIMGEGQGDTWLVGHGLLVSWTGCCGTLDIGYRQSQRRGFAIELGARLPTYPLDLDAVLSTRALQVLQR